jgi:hypothetical protein
MDGYVVGEMLYGNPLAGEADIGGFVLEGDGATSFPRGRCRLEGVRDPQDGQKANIVFWCPETFPDNIRITWDFHPMCDPGLCILFFAAKGIHGEDVHDPGLAKRNGPYEQYHHGDINALHVSYFRYKHPSERAFSLCNLRKSYGFHMVAQAPCPIPPIPLASPPYRVAVTKVGPRVQLHIGQGEHPDLLVLDWVDDGRSHGPVLDSGKIAFRQMTPMIAEYANLAVHRMVPAK